MRHKTTRRAPSIAYCRDCATLWNLVPPNYNATRTPKTASPYPWQVGFCAHCKYERLVCDSRHWEKPPNSSEPNFSELDAPTSASTSASMPIVK